jgi:hypothetical protein
MRSGDDKVAPLVREQRARPQYLGTIRENRDRDLRHKAAHESILLLVQKLVQLPVSHATSVHP